jgi:hypothetical protein
VVNKTKLTYNFDHGNHIFILFDYSVNTIDLFFFYRFLLGKIFKKERNVERCESRKVLFQSYMFLLDNGGHVIYHPNLPINCQFLPIYFRELEKNQEIVTKMDSFIENPTKQKIIKIVNGTFAMNFDVDRTNRILYFQKDATYLFAFLPSVEMIIGRIQT